MSCYLIILPYPISLVEISVCLMMCIPDTVYLLKSFYIYLHKWNCMMTQRTEKGQILEYWKYTDHHWRVNCYLLQQSQKNKID